MFMTFIRFSFVPQSMREINCFMAGKTNQMYKFPTWSHKLGGSSFTPTPQSKNVFSSVVIKKRAKGQNIFPCLLNNANKNKKLGALLFPGTENWMPWIVGGHNFNLNFNHFVFQYKPKTREVFFFNGNKAKTFCCLLLTECKAIEIFVHFFYWSVNDIVVMIFRRKRGKLGYFDKQKLLWS